MTSLWKMSQGHFYRHGLGPHNFYENEFQELKLCMHVGRVEICGSTMCKSLLSNVGSEKN